MEHPTTQASPGGAINEAQVFPLAVRPGHGLAAVLKSPGYHGISMVVSASRQPYSNSTGRQRRGLLVSDIRLAPLDRRRLAFSPEYLKIALRPVSLPVLLEGGAPCEEIIDCCPCS